MIKIVQAKTEKDCAICDEFLTKLIKYESGFDKVINGSLVVNGMAKNCVANEENYFAYAVEDETPIGYIYGYVKERTGKVSTTNVMMIDAVFVEENCRGKGVGKKLINSFEDWSKTKFGNDYVVEITYLTNNTKAQKFYEGLGYKSVKTILRK